MPCIMSRPDGCAALNALTACDVGIPGTGSAGFLLTPERCGTELRAPVLLSGDIERNSGADSLRKPEDVAQPRAPLSGPPATGFSAGAQTPALVECTPVQSDRL